jgi:hypothetical protein
MYYMKKIFLILVGLSFFVCVDAQKGFNDSIALSRNRLTKNAMITLGSWAVANIASGFIAANNANGEAKYFWLMNSYWNFFNLGIAGLAYAGIGKALSRKYSFMENYIAQHAVEKLYVFNVGLDLVYITGGFYLRERGLRESDAKMQDKYRGYGSSIIFQGGFLLLMDCVMYSLHHKNTKRMNSKLQKLELTAGPGGIGLGYKF